MTTNLKAGAEAPQFYSPQQVAQVLGIAHITVKRAVLSGEIPVVKIGTRNLIPIRWVEEAIDRAIEHVTLPLDRAVFMTGPREADSSEKFFAGQTNGTAE